MRLYKQRGSHSSLLQEDPSGHTSNMGKKNIARKVKINHIASYFFYLFQFYVLGNLGYD